MSKIKWLRDGSAWVSDDKVRGAYKIKKYGSSMFYCFVFKPTPFAHYDGIGNAASIGDAKALCDEHWQSK